MSADNSCYTIIEVFLIDIDGNSPTDIPVVYLIVDIVNGAFINIRSSFNEATKDLMDILISNNKKITQYNNEDFRSLAYQCYLLCTLIENDELFTIHSHHALLPKNDICRALVHNLKINGKFDFEKLVKTNIDRYILSKAINKPTI